MKFVLLISIACAVFWPLASSASVDHFSEMLKVAELDSIKSYIELATGNTPSQEVLLEFGRKAILQRRPDVLSYLLKEFNFPINSKIKSQTDCDLLHLAISQNDSDAVRALLHAGFSLEGLGPLYRTPLILAVETGRSLEIIKLLIESGANPDLRDSDGKRAIDYAANGLNTYEYLSALSK